MEGTFLLSEFSLTYFTKYDHNHLSVILSNIQNLQIYNIYIPFSASFSTLYCRLADINDHLISGLSDSANAACGLQGVYSISVAINGDTDICDPAFSTVCYLLTDSMLVNACSKKAQ